MGMSGDGTDLGDHVVLLAFNYSKQNIYLNKFIDSDKIL